MPKGRRLDQAKVLQTLRQVRDAVVSGKSLTEARRAVGVTASTHQRWTHRFGRQLEREAAAQKKATPRPRTARAARQARKILGREAAPEPAGRRDQVARAVHRRRQQLVDLETSGRGPTAQPPRAVSPERRRRTHMENAELREVIVDLTLENARLRRERRR
jgi:hypothetical protein